MPGCGLRNPRSNSPKDLASPPRSSLGTPSSACWPQVPSRQLLGPAHPQTIFHWLPPICHRTIFSWGLGRNEGESEVEPGPWGRGYEGMEGGVTSLIGQLCSRTGCKSPWTPPPVAPIPVLTCNWLSFQGGGTHRGLVPLKGWERLRAHLSLGWSLQTAGAAVPRTILLSSVMACVSAGTPPQGSGWRGGRQLGGCGQSGS